MENYIEYRQVTITENLTRTMGINTLLFIFYFVYCFCIQQNLCCSSKVVASKPRQKQKQTNKCCARWKLRTLTTANGNHRTDGLAFHYFHYWSKFVCIRHRQWCNSTPKQFHTHSWCSASFSEWSFKWWKLYTGSFCLLNWIFTVHCAMHSETHNVLFIFNERCNPRTIPKLRSRKRTELQQTISCNIEILLSFHAW